MTRADGHRKAGHFLVTGLHLKKSHHISGLQEECSPPTRG